MWKKTGAIYDGDWKEGLRHGFGMYSVKKGDEHVKEYAGGWKNDMKHVCMWATPTHWFLVLRFFNFAEHSLITSLVRLYGTENGTRNPVHLPSFSVTCALTNTNFQWFLPLLSFWHAKMAANFFA